MAPRRSASGRPASQEPSALRRLRDTASAMRRWLGRRPTATDRLWSQDAQSLLRRPECPVCHAILEWVPRHLFWFFEEQYHHPTTIEEMQDSLGFCRTHAALFQEISPPYRIGYVHLLMSLGTLERLRRLQRAARAIHRARDQAKGPRVRPAVPTEGLERRGPCLICRQEEDTARNTSHLLMYALRDPQILADIESFGKLCTPHFRLAAEAAPGELLRLLIPVQVKGHLAVAGQVHALPCGDPSPAGEPNEPLRSACRALAKVVGADVNGQRRALPAVGRPESGAGAAPRDPVPSPDRMLKLLDEERCPICTLAQEALAIYVGWYEGGVREWLAGPRRLGDGFEWLCREHLWRLAQRVDPAILLDLGLCMAEADRGRLGRAEAILAEPAPPPPWRTGVRIWKLPRQTRLWLAKMYRREERRVARAKWTMRDGPQCPACAHLATLTRRSLNLLFAVLQDATARDRYRAAWGLCMQHFSDGLSLPAEPEVLEAVVDVQVARLATLGWELEEYYRKFAWNVRYEPKGPEQHAWARAIERFSGTDLGPLVRPGRE